MTLITDIKKIIRCIPTSKLRQSSIMFGTTTIFCIIVGIFCSYITALLMMFSYFGGIYSCWYCLERDISISECLLLLIRFFCNSPYDKENSEMCNICSHMNCNRHGNYSEGTPWRNTFIDGQLNQTLQNFYKEAINEFVLQWYRRITDDEQFINELHYGLRYITANTLKSFQQLDHASFLSSEVLPHLINYIDNYRMRSFQLEKCIHQPLMSDAEKTETVTFDDQSQVKYFQNMTAKLIPLISPKNYTACANYNVLMRALFSRWLLMPLVELVTDPNLHTVQNITSLRLSKRSDPCRNPSQFVAILNGFAKGTQKTTPTTFSIGLKAIINNVELLYVLLKFLMRTGDIHLLQFILDSVELEKKLINSNFTATESTRIHSEALTLFNRYVTPSSTEFIGCPLEMVNAFDLLLLDGPHAVVQLKHFHCLNALRQFASNVLESKWLPLLFQTSEFYAYVCGPRNMPLKSSVNNRKPANMSSDTAISKMPSNFGKIRETWKTMQSNRDDSIFNILTGNRSDTSNGLFFRDLSSWQISLQTHEIRYRIVWYSVNVIKLDMIGGASTKSWTVTRTDQDFFTLKIKLIEFHGDAVFSDISFPMKSDSIVVRMAKYEQFMKQLLQKSFLRGSDLLYTFLTVHDENFTTLVSCLSNNQDISNIYRSVAYKFRKERGQNLEEFLRIFLQSVKVFQREPDWQEQLSLTATHDVNCDTSPMEESTDCCKSVTLEKQPICDCMVNIQMRFYPASVVESVFYILKYLLGLPNNALHLYAAISSASEETIIYLTNDYIKRLIYAFSYEPYLINLLLVLQEKLYRTNKRPPSAKSHMNTAKNHEHIQEYNTSNYLISTITTRIKANNKWLDNTSLEHCFNKKLVCTLLESLLCTIYPDYEKSPNI